MARLEKDIEQKLVDACKRRGMTCEKLINVSRRGWPDRTIMGNNGKVVLVETKKTRNDKLRALQIHMREELQDRGFIVLVVHEVGEIGFAVDIASRATLS